MTWRRAEAVIDLRLNYIEGRCGEPVRGGGT
jgi:hypothetical protein